MEIFLSSVEKCYFGGGMWGKEKEWGKEKFLPWGRLFV